MAADDVVVLPVAAVDVKTVYGPWESSSRPGLKHYTYHMADGKFKCTCEGFSFRGHCKHVDQIQNALGEEDGEDFDVSM